MIGLVGAVTAGEAEGGVGAMLTIRGGALRRMGVSEEEEADEE